MKGIHVTALLAGVATLAVATSAAAQTAAPAASDASAPTEGLTEIVVTAQKRSENLQRVPIAVTALSNEQLSVANVSGQVGLAKVTPSLTFNQNGSFVGAWIRGVGTDFASAGLEPSVSVYFDDIYVPRAVSGFLDFADIDHVEVLKGPQGTLYGRNATGGAIRLLSSNPRLGETSASLKLIAGSFGRIGGSAVLNLPVSEKVALRVSASRDDDRGFGKNLYPGAKSKRFGSNDQESFTGKLLVEATEDFTIKAQGFYFHTYNTSSSGFRNLQAGAPEQIGAALGGCVGQGFYTICNDQGTSSNMPSPINRNWTWGGSLRLDYNTGIGTLSSITGYVDIHDKNAADLDGTGANLLHTKSEPDTKQFTQEIQLTSDNDGPLSYVAGLYFLREKGSYNYALSGNAIGPGIALADLNRERTHSFAPYAQADYKFTDQLTLTVGLRYTWESKKLLYNDLAPGPLGPTGFPSSFFSRTSTGPAGVKFKAFTPKATVSYRATDDLMLYATVARGFKSGGLSLPATAPVDTVNPEKLTDFEGGWKYQSGNFRFNGAVFYYRYSDMQVSVTTPIGTTNLQNAAGARVKGLESDILWRIVDPFELSAGGSYIDSKYVGYFGDSFFACGALPAPGPGVGNVAVARAACAAAGGLGLQAVPGTDLSGNVLKNSPKLSLYAQGTYTLPLGGNMGEVKFTGTVNYRSKAYFDAAKNTLDAARKTFSGRIGWTSADERLSLSVLGENLSGVKYYTAKPIFGPGGLSVAAPPRRVYVQAGIKL